MEEKTEAKTAGRNFIDFILDTKDDEALLKEFLQVASATKLKEFFITKGYAVTEEDCIKLIEAKKDLNLEGGIIPPAY